MTSRKKEFQRDLLESVKQMRSGQAARFTPVGTQPPEKDTVNISLRLPAEVIERWKATGPGWALTC